MGCVTQTYIVQLVLYREQLKNDLFLLGVNKMIKTLIDIDKLLEDTKMLAKKTSPIEYISVEIDNLLNETSDMGQMN